MRIEVPMCTRCCFCLPLRYSLIFWGYLKLIVSLLLLTSVALVVYHLFEIYVSTEQERFRTFAIFNFVLVLFLLCHVIFCIGFLIGEHKKNVRLLRLYYRYCVVMWMLLCIGCLILMAASIARMVEYTDDGGIYNEDSSDMWFLLATTESQIINIILDGYFVLLLRSEIVKLEKNKELKTVNISADHECTRTVTITEENPEIIKIKILEEYVLK